MNRQFLVLAVLMIGAGIAQFSAMAAPLYTWTDERGVVHFSTAPRSNEAKRADLPPITRGEMRLAQARVVSCEQHGGVDCRAGADADGSVICGDGFRDSTLRFRFSCSAPKLEVADVSPPNAEGLFSVFIRNRRSVDAQKLSVALRREEGSEMALSGPATIEAYGLAEYQGRVSSGDLLGVELKASDVQISCANCPG